LAFSLPTVAPPSNPIPEPPQFFEHLRDAPTLLRQLYRELTVGEGIRLLLNLQGILLLASMALYIVSPFDLLPEAM